MTPEVVIVGAGPAGSVLAGLLAGRGVRVLLLEAARHPRPKPCGECLNPGAVALLERLGVLPLAGGLRLRGWRLVDPKRHAEVDFPGGRSAVAMERSRLDHVLLAWASRRGAQVEEGVKVTDLLRMGDRVMGVRAGERAVPAPLVVGADGLRSVVAKRLGLHTRGTAPARVAFTGHWEGVQGLTDRGELHLDRGRVVGVAPLGGGRANLVLVVPGSEAARLDPVSRLRGWPSLASRLAEAQPVDTPRATGPFHQPALALTRPGVLLVGDAAGYYDPLTGQGVYRALRSAELAAAAALAYLEGDGEALDRYQQQVRAEFEPAERWQRWVDTVVTRPGALGLSLGLLRLCPPAGRYLLALLGDCHSPKGAR